MPVFADKNGPFGSPTSDSEKAMIRLDSKEIMTVIISFSGKDELGTYLDEAEYILKQYTDAIEISKHIFL